jgi:hypothetical protein
LGYRKTYPRFEKQTRGFQNREAFLKLKTLKTAVEQMFSPVYLHKMLCFPLFLRKLKKQFTIPVIQTHEKYEFGTGLVQVWNNRCLLTKRCICRILRVSTDLIRVSEKPELFQTKTMKIMLQDCAKDLGTSKFRTEVAKRCR